LIQAKRSPYTNVRCFSFRLKVSGMFASLVVVVPKGPGAVSVYPYLRAFYPMGELSLPRDCRVLSWVPFEIELHWKEVKAIDV